MGLSLTVINDNVVLGHGQQQQKKNDRILLHQPSEFSNERQKSVRRTSKYKVYGDVRTYDRMAKS